MSAYDEAVVERLDRLITLMSIAHADALERLRSEIDEDPVASQILAAVAEEWMSSGDLKRQVSVTAKVSEKTVQRGIATLISQGLLRSQGSGRGTSYKSSGVL